MAEHMPGTALMQLDAKQLWHAVLADLRERLSRTAYDNWVRDTRLVAFDDDVASVAARSSIVVTTLESRFAARIGESLTRVVGRPVQVVFIVLGETDPVAERLNRETASLLRGEDADDVGIKAAASSKGGARGRQIPPERTVPSPRQIELTAAPANGLNPRYLYATYVVGSSNRFAHAASIAVAEHPGGKYNPFFVHGGVGLGKTHLMHAIGHQALALRPDLRVSYVTSEKFTNELIAAIQKQRREEFRARYREIDILMIDDIQFIAGKDATQEEFFHTFNELYQSGKQVVITSDRPPKAISALEDRLRSRFEGGLIADVQLPDFEMRMAILGAKGDELGLPMPNEVVEYIAQKDQSNIRELEGALNKVIARAQLTAEPVTLPLAMEALADVAIGVRRAKLSTSTVIEAVGRHFAVPTGDLSGQGRARKIVLPRQVAMYLMREETGATLLEIGQSLGGRDHTTVMHGIKQIEKALGVDPTLRSRLMAIREVLFSATT